MTTNALDQVKAPEEYLPAEQMKEVSIDLADAKEKAVSIKVTSEATMEEANAVCGKIRARQKGIEAFRLAIVKPFKDHIAKIDKFFKGLGANFDEPLETIEKKVLAYREKRKTAPAKSSVQEGVGMTTFVKTAEHEVVDVNALPDEFWCVDEKKLGARVRELTKDLEVGKVYDALIPGVKIKCTERQSYSAERA